MSWGIDFKADIFLSRISVHNLVQLEELIIEKELDLTRIQDLIYMYGSCNLNDVVPKEWEDAPIEFVYSKLKELFSEQRELITSITNLEYYKEHLIKEKNNGKVS
jgi:hypothetical protein